MRLHRFYIDKPLPREVGSTFTYDDMTDQIKKVFRLRGGDKVIVFDGSGQDVESEITGFDGNKVGLKVISVVDSPSMPMHDVTIAMAMIKKSGFELVVEKATELGVSRIVPVLAERSEKKGLNEERLKKIVREASEQSGRGNIPAVDRITTLEDFITRVNVANAATDSTMIAFDPSGKTKFLPTDHQNAGKTGKCVVLIGPEGGWSDKEILMFAEKNIPVYSLGDQILRAETAAISVLSLLLIR